MTRLLVATRNPGKLRELLPMLAAEGWQPLDLSTAGIEEAPHEAAFESHATFEANALAKARHFFSISGIPTLADDSGLCVDALGGRPGVQSKRWAAGVGVEGKALDEANNVKLLASLAPGDSRDAGYVCAAAFVDADDEFVARGEARGTILDAPRGSGGFGYDPYFLSDELGATFAEVSREEKARVSHRARAVAAIRASLRARR